MRLLGRLFRSARTPSSLVLEAALHEGDETLEVVGESHRQEVLWQLVGGRCPERVRHETVAVLVPEPENKYDSNAIKVLIAGQLVGYLSRDDAADYLPGLLRLMEQSDNRLVALNAAIVGGGQRRDGLGRLGVFLDHDPADFGLSY